MNDYITPEDAIAFYKTVVQLLQGDDALIICPSYYHTGATICVVNAAGMRRELDAEIQATSENLYDALMQVASQEGVASNDEK
jgi:hypothetical protein